MVRKYSFRGPLFSWGYTTAVDRLQKGNTHRKHIERSSLRQIYWTALALLPCATIAAGLDGCTIRVRFPSLYSDVLTRDQTRSVSALARYWRPHACLCYHHIPLEQSHVPQTKALNALLYSAF